MTFFAACLSRLVCGEIDASKNKRNKSVKESEISVIPSLSSKNTADEGQVLDGFGVLGHGLGAEGGGPRPSAGDFRCSGRGRAPSPPGFPRLMKAAIGSVGADLCVGP